MDFDFPCEATFTPLLLRNERFSTLRVESRNSYATI